MSRFYVWMSESMGGIKKTKRDKWDQGKEVWSQDKAQVRAVSLDANRKFAESEDKALSSVADISKIGKGASISHIWLN